MRRAGFLALFLGTGLVLGACNATAPEPPPEIDMPRTGTDMESCGAAGFEGWIGQGWDETKVAQAGSKLRVITPGMAVTADYNPERLNVELDDSGTISALSCG